MKMIIAGIILGILTVKAIENYCSWPPQRRPSIVYQEEQDGFFNKIGIAHRQKRCTDYILCGNYGTEGQYNDRQMNSAERKKYVKKG
jgi:hypothetical protein